MLGKIEASLDEKLKNVEWGEFRLGDLFEIYNTLSFNKDVLVEGEEYDYVTRTSLNQGILQTTGFVNSENINEANTWSLGLLQMDFFYRSREWYAGQFMKKIVPKIEIPKKCVPFFTVVLNKQKELLLAYLVRDVDDIFNNAIARLPVRDGEIDFEFMESFVGEIESAKFSQLDAYLKSTGLDDVNLTLDEQTALNKFNTVELGEFTFNEVFEKIKQG